MIVLKEVEDKLQELQPIALRHCSIETPIVLLVGLDLRRDKIRDEIF